MRFLATRLRVTVRVRRSVAALEADLVRPQVAGFDEEICVELHRAAARRDNGFGDPALDAVGVDLSVPRRVEAVREINPPTVAADFDHLRSAVDRLRGVARVRSSID